MRTASSLRLLLTAGLFLGLAVAFFLLRPRDEAGQQAHLLRQADPSLLRRWQWVKTYDPYDGGQMRTATEAEDRFLEFRADGTLIAHEGGQPQKGYWLLGPEEASLALVTGLAAEQVPRSASRRAWEYRHKIVRLDHRELILAWQGRHGKVQEWYRAVRPTDETRR